MKGNRVVCATWDEDKGWIEIYLEREWKEMMQQVCEIQAPEDNGGFPRRLVVSVLKKKGLVNRLEM